VTAAGRITSAPQRRLRLMIGAQVFWLAIVLLLGGWWCRLVLIQAARIAELETDLGVSEAVLNQLRTHRMVFWESLSYFILLVGSTVVVFWLYWRDVKRSRGIQAFFASMTHELRTPLTSIRLQAEAIGEEISDPGPKAWVERLLEDTQRLESQVERTLEIARVEGGGPVFPEPMELKPWLERWASACREAYPSKVRIEVAVADVSVVADATALGVVMRNLLENSLRHAKPPAAKPLEIQVSAAAEAGDVSIRFRDNGTSFAGGPRKLGEIFEKGAGSSGTGVGLYLIRVLTEQMGGKASFGTGQGFEVRIQLKGGSHGA
jgi:signal transduction histidine kinase